MKLINDVTEFRTWLIEEFYYSSETALRDISSPISYEFDFLPEAERLCPKFFPCLVYLTTSDNPKEPTQIKVISKEQLTAWANEMGQHVA
ncbi:MAG: hypothetical protein ACTH8P_07830 [Ewingella sp.]|uniref:hypothetical protein n=1 Tax=Ewingella TaxID=41201 RepID=UPI0033657A66